MIQCKEVKPLQRQFIKKTAEDLFRANKQNIAEETILNMLEDIAMFNNRGEEEDEYKTS